MWVTVVWLGKTMGPLPVRPGFILITCYDVFKPILDIFKWIKLYKYVEIEML